MLRRLALSNIKDVNTVNIQRYITKFWEDHQYQSLIDSFFKKGVVLAPFRFEVYFAVTESDSFIKTSVQSSFAGRLSVCFSS